MKFVPPLTKWQCHKQVWAEKIINIRYSQSDPHISWELANGEIVTVSNDLLCRGTSTPVGGYYVLYENGYESWSPADIFEAGYVQLK